MQRAASHRHVGTVAAAPPSTTIHCGHADKSLAWTKGLCSTFKSGCAYDASVTIEVMDHDLSHKRWAAKCDSERREVRPPHRDKIAQRAVILHTTRVSNDRGGHYFCESRAGHERVPRVMSDIREQHRREISLSLALSTKALPCIELQVTFKSRRNQHRPKCSTDQ